MYRTYLVNLKIFGRSRFNTFSHYLLSTYSRNIILTNLCNYFSNLQLVIINKYLITVFRLQLWNLLFSDPSYVIGLFPDLLPVEFRKKVEYPEAVPILQGKDLDLAVLALIKYLTEVKDKLHNAPFLSLGSNYSQLRDRFEMIS